MISFEKHLVFILVLAFSLGCGAGGSNVEMASPELGVESDETAYQGLTFRRNKNGKWEAMAKVGTPKVGCIAICDPKTGGAICQVWYMPYPRNQADFSFGMTDDQCSVMGGVMSIFRGMDVKIVTNGPNAKTGDWDDLLDMSVYPIVDGKPENIALYFNEWRDIMLASDSLDDAIDLIYSQKIQIDHRN